MAYCRWSSDNFKSDIYCYANTGGSYTIHVAHCRYVLPNYTMFGRSKINGATPQEPIGLAFDGRTLDCKNIKETIETLEELKSMGYYVPQAAFIRLRAEQRQGAT
jgi:hypothetical protein